MYFISPFPLPRLLQLFPRNYGGLRPALDPQLHHNLQLSIPFRRLLQLFPRNYGGLRPWAQRLILSCITIFTCLGVAVAVPGESGTVLTVTGATGG